MREIDILLVRHPETEANINGRLVGRGDSPYTHEGHRQLARVPRKIVAFAPDTVWTSPQERAARLARRAARLARVPVETDERLSELDFGEAEGLIRRDLGGINQLSQPSNRWHPAAKAAHDRGPFGGLLR
jgi:broad specificity phosphatase PhoE